MALQFYLGRAGTGKTTAILNRIQTRLEEDPCGSPLIYLVPEQATFQAEYALASRLGGTIRAQVLSFGRLAYRLLQECGGATRLPVDELGKQMVLRMLLEKHREELRLFHRAASQPGFTAHLARLVSECKSYGVTPDLLANVDAGAGTLAEKLHDIRLLLRAYDDYLGEDYYDTDDMLGRVAEKVARSAWLREAEVWIDGFSGFTRQEYDIIRQLMVHTRQVTVALCLDPEEEAADELSLFHPAHQTLSRLAQLAREAGVPVEEPVRFAERRRFRGSPWLAQVEREYGTWRRPTGCPAPGRQDEVVLAAGANRRAEVEAVALRIIALAREEGYRWRDMAVLVREMEGYADDIAAVFAEYGIPCFLDRKRPVLHHPLIELVRSALEVVASRWRYEAVFRCLKTDLVRPEGVTVAAAREEVDLLENYVLAYGIAAAHWSDPDPWRFHGDGDEGFAGIDAIRRKYARPLLEFERELKEAARFRVRAMTAALYQFLSDLEVPRTLEAWQRQAERNGELEEAREHGQVWNGLLAVLDQIVEVMGDERLDIPTYARILDSGLESIRLGLVPPSLDQVVVGSMERSRQPDVKALFLLGVNEGQIPLKQAETGLLDEAERDRLAAAGIELAPTATRRLLAEQYLIYQALTRPSERLWLSCALADQEGKALLPSPVMQRIREVIPDVPFRFFSGEPSGEGEADAALLGAPRPVFARLLTLLRRVKKGGSLPPFWWEVYHWFAEHSPDKARERWLLSGLSYSNRARPLSRDTSRALYGTRLSVSVSRLERFRRCPFSHFAAYGLRLEERRAFKLERFDVGELFHASLKRAVERMNESRLNWSELTEEASMALAREIVDELVPNTRSSILNRTARYRFLTGNLKRAVGRAISVLAEHAKRSRFAPLAVEVAFGPGGELPGLVLALEDGTALYVIGRIDRVDQSVADGRRFLRVIDYKSGAKELTLSDVWHGLNLQLLVYLDVVVTHAEKWLGERAEVGGVFYYQVADPLIPARRLLTREEAAKERARKLKMKGLMLADAQLAELMDEQVREGASDLLPIGLKKDGTFTAYSSVATPDQFDALKAHVRRLVSETAADMINGEIDISPYAQGQLLACTTCPYKPVCQFDPVQAGNQPRPLPQWKDDQVWAMLAERMTETTAACAGKTGEDDHVESDGQA